MSKESLLDKINKPQDLHDFDEAELAQVAQELRCFIIDTVGEIGGHFGANLGTCEITVALHSLLDSPRDKILWDVGHQAYPHKILTGRKDRLNTIRQSGGLAPFLNREESEHDIMGAGHASTSISYAVGIKEAMKRKGDGDDQGGQVVAVIGDGAMTGGVAYEALNNAGHLQTPIVILLNDNGMSISPNVGAMSTYFSKIRLNRKLYRARDEFEKSLTKLPIGIGSRIEQLGPRFKEAIKAFYAPGLFFEELDIAYVGVIDGHDVSALRHAMEKALQANRPVLVHVKTIKGKGFAPAEHGGFEGMEEWHAAKPSSIVNRRPAVPNGKKPNNGPPQWTQVFGDAIVDEARNDSSVVGITAAMASGTGLSRLCKEMPDRYFDVGIAEQHAVLLAAGMSLEGMKPVVAVYSTFLQRAFDQIVHDVGLQRLKVVFAMDRAGLVGDDGPTHHGAYDVSYLRLIPNMVLMAPKDEAELVNMLHTALAGDCGPVALRYPRGAAIGVDLPQTPEVIDIGRGEVLANGDRVALVGYGECVQLCLEAAEEMKKRAGVEPTVVNARFAKPLDKDLMGILCREHEHIVTVEDNALAGGFGSAVLEELNEFGSNTTLERFGIPDRYIAHGSPELLRQEIGLTAMEVARRTARRLGVELAPDPVT